MTVGHSQGEVAAAYVSGAVTLTDAVLVVGTRASAADGFVAGDYAMAVSLFKRALSALNGSLALLNEDGLSRHRHVMAWREQALPCLFDLREVWLRVIAECREELDRPVDDES